MTECLMKTARLWLRELEPADWPALYAYRSDPEVRRYDRFGPNSPEQVQEVLGRMLSWQHEQPRLRYAGAIELQARRQVIGEWLIMVSDSEPGSAEIGFMLHRSFWGQGYATEAASALLEYGLLTLRMQRMTAVCHAENRASERVLQKLGMRPAGTASTPPDRHYAITLHDWTSRRSDDRSATDPAL